MEEVIPGSHELKLFGAGNSPLPIYKIYLNANGDTEYMAFALRGALTSEAKWRVCHFIYDGSYNVIGREWTKANQIADNYASLEYA